MKDRNSGLHLVRGLCSLGVVVYHYLSWEHSVVIESAGAFLVYAFFILSALTLMIVHGKEFATGIAFRPLAIFYKKRVARILPLLLAIAIVSALYSTYRSGSWQMATFARAFLTGTTLFGFQMPGMISNVVAAWSLGIETVFYFIFPVIALVAANVRLRTILVTTALLVVAQQAAILIIAPEQGAAFWFQYANPLVFSPFFALGIVIYRRPLEVRSINIWISMATLAMIAGLSAVTPVDIYRNPAVYLLLTVFTAVAVLTAYSAKVPKWAWPAADFLGNVSYALYLTHWFSLELAGYIVRRLGVAPALPAVFAVLSLTSAYLCFRFFEVPARDWLRGERNGAGASLGATVA